MTRHEHAEGGGWRRRILLALVATLLAAGAGEIGLRLFWHNSYAGDSTDHELRLGLQPAGRDYRVDRHRIDAEHPVVRVRTDARSYILPSFQHEHPDATIAFMGGSTTECSVVREDLRFPALIAARFAEQGLLVNALNAGAAGNTAHDSVNVLFNHVVLDRPDVAVLMQATNDLGILARHGGYQTRMGGPLKFKQLARWIKQVVTGHVYVAALVRKVLSAYNVREITESELRERNGTEVADRVPIVEFERRLTVFVHVCRDFGIQPVLVTQPLSSSTNDLTPEWANLGGQDRFNAAIRTVGMVESAPVIDLAREIQAVPGWNEPMELFYDGMHVTDQGSQVYARIIGEHLRPLVLAIPEVGRRKRMRESDGP